MYGQSLLLITTSRSISSCFCSFSSTVERILWRRDDTETQSHFFTLIYTLKHFPVGVRVNERGTFTAMIWPVGLWTILLTEPYAPRPISPRSLRSSAVKSQCCSGEIFSFPDDSMLCVRRRSLEDRRRME